MKKSQRLQSIIDIENRQEQAALVVLSQHRTKIQELEDQLENLQKYKQDYLQKHDNESSMSIQSLMEFRAFIAKLDQAIDGQVQSLQLEQQALEKAQSAWESRRQKVKGLQKVCHQAIEQEIKNQQKAEQAELDERAARSTNKSGM